MGKFLHLKYYYKGYKTLVNAKFWTRVMRTKWSVVISFRFAKYMLCCVCFVDRKGAILRSCRSEYGIIKECRAIMCCKW